MNAEQASIKQVLQTVIKKDDIPDISPLDVELLLAYVLGKSRAYLRAYPEKLLSEQEVTAFQTLLSRRQQGEPVAYLLGSKEFWSLNFRVTPDVLIPRPETELLVSYLLEQFGHHPKYRVLDLGTGSGAIACAVASEKRDWVVLAADCSDKAITLAENNARANGLANVEIVTSDWFEKIEGTFDLILSNPPYIAKGDPNLDKNVLQHEPEEALIAGQEGYADLFHLIEASKAYLNPGACLILEHGFAQAEKVRAYFQEQGYHSVLTLQDLNGLDRITLGYC